MASHSYELPIAKVGRTNSTPFHKSKTLITETETETETEDYISKLPDSIVIHILTLLPLVDTIRTSLLSKRWNHLWVSIPNLVFPTDQWRYRDFVSFIDHTLSHYSSDIIHTFSLEFDYEEYYNKKNVSSWLRFAVDHKVKQLHFLLYDLVYDACATLERYTLPTYLFHNGTLIDLKLRYCSFDSCGGDCIINWSLLNKLSIARVSINDHLMEKLLLGCPVLESFELIECFTFTKIEISSRVLKELIVDGYYESDDRNYENDVKYVNTVRIIAPYLRFLVITGNIMTKKCSLENLSSLVEARIDFKWSGVYEDHDDIYKDLFEEDDVIIMEFKTMLTEIFARIKHVEKLTLGFSCLQALSLLNASQLPSPFSICKNLILDTSLEKWTLQGIASMLQSCPELKTLTIDLLNYDNVTSHSHFDPSFWRNHFYGKYLSCMEHLKMVKIIGLFPGYIQTYAEVIEFLQYVLKHAKVLEKLSIEKRRNMHTNIYDLFSIAQALLRFPRSSPFAEIQLN